MSSSSDDTVVLGKLEILKLFMDGAIQFFSLLNRLFDDPDLIVVRLLFENQMPIEDLFNVFRARITPLTEKVRKHNEQFFLSDNTIFSGFPEDKVIKWKARWRSNRLDDDDRQCIWKWFEFGLDLVEMDDKRKNNYQ